MKILVILGHPDAQSFNHAIFATYAKNISPENEVKTLDLGELKFDPVLRFGYREIMRSDAEVENSRKLVKWADKIVFVYPIWWSSMPSLLKGWLDRVLTPQFAYVHEKTGMRGLLAATAELWLTCDAPAIYYKTFDKTPVNLMKKDILASCGIKVSRVKIFGNTRNSTAEAREQWLAKVAAAARANGENGVKKEGK